MKHIKDFKLYEATAVAKEKYFYILLDRSHYDSFDKRVKKLSTPDTVYVVKVDGNNITGMNTALYQPSKLAELADVERSLVRRNDRLTLSNVENMVKFAKRNTGCIAKEYDTLDELKASLEVNKHITNYRELQDALGDISAFIKKLRPSALSSRKYSYRNHLLVNSGSYMGKNHLIIDAIDQANFSFQTHYTGSIKVDVERNGSYNANSFLTRSDYFNSSNDSYELYHLNKTQQTALINLANETRALFVAFSKDITDTFKNPK